MKRTKHRFTLTSIDIDDGYKLFSLENKSIRILAIDTATHCGFAVSDEIYGVWDLTPRRDEGGGMRLLRFKSKFTEVLDLEKINLVVFERPGGMHKSSIIVQSELQGLMKLICEDRKIPYRGYSSKEIKKFATGNGNAGKPLMIKAAREKYKYTGNNDNEADALHLLHLAQSEYK